MRLWYLVVVVALNGGVALTVTVLFVSVARRLKVFWAVAFTVGEAWSFVSQCLQWRCLEPWLLLLCVRADPGLLGVCCGLAAECWVSQIMRKRLQ